MEQNYKDARIVVTVMADRQLRWRSICQVSFMKDSKPFVKHLEFVLDYDTADQAERAGLVFAKIWIDAGKPETSPNDHKQR